VFQAVSDGQDILQVAVEKTFGLKLTSKEILSWEDVGEMADAIYAKLA